VSESIDGRSTTVQQEPAEQRVTVLQGIQKQRRRVLQQAFSNRSSMAVSRNPPERRARPVKPAAMPPAAPPTAPPREVSLDSARL
jgi:hypothetical protein